MNDEGAVPCVVYRCSRQNEMYLYLRPDIDPADLPGTLGQKMGHLHRVMDLMLTPRRKLARVDVDRVITQLQSQGWFLQLPPPEYVQGHLQDGD